MKAVIIKLYGLDNSKSYNWEEIEMKFGEQIHDYKDKDVINYKSFQINIINALELQGKEDNMNFGTISKTRLSMISTEK